MESDRDGGSLDFDRFFMEEQPKMVAVALALTGRPEAARDLAQDAMAAAYREWESVSRLDRPGAWLRRVTINAAISWRRRRRSEQRATDRLAAEPISPGSPAPPEDGFWDAVRALPDRQRSVTVLYYVEDRSVADIAAILEVADGTVKATLSKARKNLAARLGLDDEEASR